MSSDESSVQDVIPVYAKEDDNDGEEVDDVVVSATVIEDVKDVSDKSNQDDNDDVCSEVDDSIELDEVDDLGEEDSKVSCAAVVPAEVGEEETKEGGAEEVKEEGESIVSPPKKKKRKRRGGAGKEHDEIPSVKDLGIPFRAIKRIMKVDPDIATVQNEAAVVTTYAVELFVKKIVNESYNNAKKRGRNTVKYEDLSEARAMNQNMNFLDTLLP